MLIHHPSGFSNIHPPGTELAKATSAQITTFVGPVDEKKVSEAEVEAEAEKPLVL
jgi:hypothetical protein